MTVVDTAAVVHRLPALVAIEQVQDVLVGLPVFIAGSAAAAYAHPHISDESYSDIDVFCSTPQSTIAAAQRLMGAGFKLSGRSDRVWERWMRVGWKQWHTNSLKLELPVPGTGGIEVNVIYKLTDGHPTTSLAQVIESFDFGLLAMGLDSSTGQWRDMRSYLFPDVADVNTTPLPLMPNKRANWRNGFISQYNGIREIGRYAKYHGYGYDLTAVKDDLITGYWAASEYLVDRTDHAEKVQLGMIYQSIAIKIEDNDYDALTEASNEIEYLDDLDKIMEALE